MDPDEMKRVAPDNLKSEDGVEELGDSAMMRPYGQNIQMR